MLPRLRKATANDIHAIAAFIAPHANAERQLPRTPRAIAERLRDWTVAVRGEQIVGAASVRLVDVALAEISVVVGQDESVEAALIDSLLDETRGLGVGRIFVATNDPGPFEAWGFIQRPIAAIPEKHDRQCLRCARMPRCLKVGMERELAVEPLRAVG